MSQSYKIKLGEPIEVLIKKIVRDKLERNNKLLELRENQRKCFHNWLNAISDQKNMQMLGLNVDYNWLVKRYSEEYDEIQREINKLNG